jgi:hypothetical protein
VQNLHVEMTTVLFEYRSEWLLAVPYSENGPQGDAFRNHGGHQIECDGQLRKIPKGTFCRCLQQWQNRWSKCVCVCVCVCVRKGPTLKVIR